MVKIFKLDWVEHEGFPIWSISVHPDSKRFATCGGDSKVKIWDLSALLSYAKEDAPQSPKETERCLAVLTNHQGAVNCVRWSKNGKYLASCSDDKTVIIWELHPGQGQVFGEKDKNIENWRTKVLLRGHTEDVADLSWSPDSSKLASCSIDNNIIVWDLTTTDPKKTKLFTLTGHNGYIKGISWDPIGRYLASQGDDRTLIVWKLPDFKVEQKITIPFRKTSANVFFKRLSWSPDGAYLLAACGVKDSKHVAPIIRRSDWSYEKDFVGHHKAVVCTQWNPVTYRTSNNKKSEPFLCCALGGQDNYVSVWSTNKTRALVVIKELFEQSILDLGWTYDGNNLLMCSGDGTMGVCAFSEGDIGVPVPQSEVDSVLMNVYGDMNSTFSPETLVEDPNQLQLEEKYRKQYEKKKKEKKKKDKEDTHIKKKKRKDKEDELMDEEDETAPKSKKRIKKKKTDGVDEIDLTNTDDEEESDEEDEEDEDEDDGTSGRSDVGELDTDNEDRIRIDNQIHTNKEDSRSQMQSQSIQTPSGTVTQILTTLPDGKKRITPQFIGAPGSLPPTNSIFSFVSQQPAPVMDTNNNTTKTTTTTTNTATTATNRTQTTINGTNLQSSITSKTDRRKKKRKRVTEGTTSNNRVRKKPKTGDGEPTKITLGGLRGSSWLLSIPKTGDSLVREINLHNATNNHSGIGVPPKPLLLESLYDQREGISKIRCVQDKQELWRDRLKAKAILVTGSQTFIAIGCSNGDLYIYTTQGRRIFPCLCMGPSPTAMLSCDKKGKKLLVVMCDGQINMWDVLERKHLLKTKLGPLKESLGKGGLLSAEISDQGKVIIITGASEAFLYDTGMQSWLRIADKCYPLSEFQTNLFDSWMIKRGPLLTIQMRASSLSPSEAHTRLNNLSGSLDKDRSTETLAHIENQIAACIVLRSGKEYKQWVEAYVKKLAFEAHQEKLDHFCEELLGPRYYVEDGGGDDVDGYNGGGQVQDDVAWKPNILGISKRQLLQDMLPLMSPYRTLQRTVARYQDELCKISQTVPEREGDGIHLEDVD